MRTGLEACDRVGTFAYLESSNERNLPLHGRQGFRVTAEEALPGCGPMLWLFSAGEALDREPVYGDGTEACKRSRPF